MQVTSHVKRDFTNNEILLNLPRISQNATTFKILESKYDNQFKLIFEAIRELMQQEQLDKNRPRIGYKLGKGE